MYIKIGRGNRNPHQRLPRTFRDFPPLRQNLPRLYVKKLAYVKPSAILPRASARAVFATLPRTFRATAFKPSANLPRTVLRRFTYVYYHRLRVDMGCPKRDSGSLQGLGETAVERKKVREH